MKKISLTTFLGIIAVFSFACGGGESAENANVNVNLNTNANTAEQKPQNGELPAYTDAATALADGNKFFDENQIEKAIEAYKQATKLNPDLGEAHFKLGIAYLQIESEQELVETPAVPTEPETNKKKSASKKNDEKKSNSTIAFENAETAYKKAIKENPKDDVAHFYLGRVYDRLNEDEDSRKSFEQAVKLKPDNTQYQTELGAILMKLAQYDEAVRALKKAIELDDANAQAQELLEDAEAGKKRVDFGADKLKDNIKVPQDQQKTGRTDKKTGNSSKETPATPGEKAPEPKAPEKKPETSNPPKKP